MTKISGQTDKKTVFILEENPGRARDAVVLLKEAGYSVETAPSVTGLMGLMSAGDPDVLLLDWEIKAGMSGAAFACMDDIKHSKIGIVMTSGIEREVATLGIPRAQFVKADDFKTQLVAAVGKSIEEAQKPVSASAARKR